MVLSLVSVFLCCHVWKLQKEKSKDKENCYTCIMTIHTFSDFSGITGINHLPHHSELKAAA
jgi:hypothetical protein